MTNPSPAHPPSRRSPTPDWRDTVQPSKGAVHVDEYLTVPAHPELYTCGHIAAVPGPARRT
jgi:NADH dehydrogenase FAD-containing subunit